SPSGQFQTFSLACAGMASINQTVAAMSDVNVVFISKLNTTLGIVASMMRFDRNLKHYQRPTLGVLSRIAFWPATIPKL
ncbi:MAG: hypothetical protein AAFP97_09360, partial [Pseudomonadota bacterium]